MPDDDIIVTTPDGTEHHFPASATRDQISAVLNPALEESSGGFKGALAAGKEFIQNAPEIGAAKFIANNLPIVGATIGSVAGATAGPAGAIGGAALGGAGGEAIQQNINRLRGLSAPSTPLAAAKDIGIQGAVQGGIEGLTRGVGSVAVPYVKAAGERMMQSALKPSSAIRGVLRDVKAGVPVPKVVQTLLDEGVNVSKGGLAKLNDIIGGINTEVRDVITNLPGTIEPKTIAAHSLPTAYGMAKDAAAAETLPAFGKVIDNFLNHPVFKGAMTPAETQAMKEATYKGIDYAKEASASVAAKKSLAYGAKVEIEEAAKSAGRNDIRALNAREGAAIEAMDAVAKRVFLHGNSNPTGLALLAHGKAAFLGLLVDRSPVIKSMLARGLYTPAAHLSGISPHLMRSLVAAVASTPDEEQ